MRKVPTQIQTNNLQAAITITREKNTNRTKEFQRNEQFSVLCCTMCEIVFVCCCWYSFILCPFFLCMHKSKVLLIKMTAPSAVAFVCVPSSVQNVQKSVWDFLFHSKLYSQTIAIAFCHVFAMWWPIESEHVHHLVTITRKKLRQWRWLHRWQQQQQQIQIPFWF